MRTFHTFINRHCYYKRKHKTLKDGLIALLEKYPLGVNSVYKCAVCGYYHIGHIGENAKRRHQQKHLMRRYLKWRKVNNA